MSKSKDYTLGFLSGALVGSLVALLYAPDKGSNTRDVISYRLSTYMDDLNQLIEKLTREKENISDAKKKGDMVVEDARQRAEDLIKEAEDLLTSIEETKKSAQNGEKEQPTE